MINVDHMNRRVAAITDRGFIDKHVAPFLDWAASTSSVVITTLIHELKYVCEPITTNL